MIRRALVAAVPVLVCATLAQAQIIRPQLRNTPTAWASLGIGYMQQQGFYDATSNSTWDFGSAPQWRASIEFPLGYGGTTWGFVGTLAKMPLIFSTTNPLPSNGCFSCDADATLSQVFAILRMGGTSGFHQVIDLDAGATMFSNFRRTSDGAKLGGSTTRMSFAVAYGFGYGFSPRAQLFFTQEYGLTFLPRQAGNANNFAQETTLRIGGRYGLGGR